ncbi:hypothetical protein LLG95_10075 [bacterium]|nr:hypothetical protein [bacterium]
MSSQVFRLGRLMTAVIAVAMMLGAGSAHARLLKLQLLSPQDASRLNEQAKAEYEQGLNWVNKIDYPAAFKHFNAAIEAQPENIFLRYIAVQMGIYLGDTRKGKPAIEYYEATLTNLNAIDASANLNARERERVANYIDLVTKLKDAVGQRDMMRLKFGRDIAKQYAADMYKKPGETEEQGTKTPETAALERAGIKTQTPGSQMNTPPAEQNTGVDITMLYKRTPRQGTLKRGMSASPEASAGGQSATGESATGSVSGGTK